MTDDRKCPGLYGSVAANEYHPAGSCDACAEPPASVEWAVHWFGADVPAFEPAESEMAARRAWASGGVEFGRVVYRTVTRGPWTEA